MNDQILISKNPFSPSPRGPIPTGTDLVGREELAIDFWHFVDLAANKKLIPVILRANYGGGKTAALKWLTERFVSKQNIPSYVAGKKILPIYTKLAHPKISEIVSSFVDAVRLRIDEEHRSQIENALKLAKSKIAQKGLHSEHMSSCLLYVSLLDSLYSLGYDVIIHLIDEFEAIEELAPEQARGFLHEFRDFLDEVGERPVLMAIGCTDDAYRMMEELHPALVSRVPQEFRRQADTKLQFTLENALDFVATRVESAREKNPDLSNPYFPFIREAIEYLYEKTNGNIRTMEQACYFAVEQAKTDNQTVNRDRIARVLHKVIKSKEGFEAKRQLFDLIDDPKLRRRIEDTVKKGTVEELKQLVTDGFNGALALLSFDYQLKYRDEALGELVSLAGVNTQAYRTVPIDVLFFATTVPRDVGHSEVAECEKLRNQFKASLGIVLRLSTDSSAVLTESTLDLAIPTSLFEQLAIIPHVSRLDADRISRSVDADLELTRHLERWIKGKIESGRIIGDRFKQFEESLYVALWEIGEEKTKLDRISEHLKDKWSKATLKTRLLSLQEKQLVEFDQDRVSWKISPIMHEIIRIIKDEFKSNPVTALDLRTYFVGGSIDTLREYLRLMTQIGLLEEVHIAVHLAYKVPDHALKLTEAKDRLQSWISKSQSSESFPAGLKSEIERKLALSERILEKNSANASKDSMASLCASHRVISLIGEIEGAVHAIEESVLKLERQHARLINRANSVLEKLQSTTDQNFGSLQRDVDSIIQNVRTAFEGDFKIRGKQEQVERAFASAEDQLNDIEEFLTGTVEMARKLAETLQQTNALIDQVKSMSSRYQIQSTNDALSSLATLFQEAKASYDNQDFAKAEFLLLKILQNEIVRNVLQKVNLELAETEGNAKRISESALSVTRITNRDLSGPIQDIRLQLAEAKENLAANDLQRSVRILDSLRDKMASQQNLMIQEIEQWAEEKIPENLPVAPNEIANNNSMSLGLVLDGLQLLLRSDRICVLHRGKH